MTINKDDKPATKNNYSQYFSIFSQVSKAIHSGQNTGEVLERIVGYITDIMKAKGCIFWIIDTGKKSIETKISHGFSYRSLELVDYDTLVTIFDPTNSDMVFVENAREDERIPDLERLGKQRVGSITGFFFNIVGNYTGILAVYFTLYRKLSLQEEELVRALGEQGAIALHRTLTYDDKMLENLRQIVEGFTLALEAKDENTHGHSLRVADFARMTAKQMKLDPKQISEIYHAGLLHDIGKIGMGDEILEKLGMLTKKEMDQVKKHPEIGARIIKPLSFLNGVEPLILSHHERFDGSGYPSRLKGEEIPLGARILAVCDAFETMFSGRGHMPKLPILKAIESLKKGINIQFDPDVIKAFFAMLQSHPEVIDTKESMDRCLKELQIDIDSIAVKNLVKKKMEHHFPTII